MHTKNDVRCQRFLDVFSSRSVFCSLLGITRNVRLPGKLDGGLKISRRHTSGETFPDML